MRWMPLLVLALVGCSGNGGEDSDSDSGTDVDTGTDAGTDVVMVTPAGEVSGLITGGVTLTLGDDVINVLSDGSFTFDPVDEAVALTLQVTAPAGQVCDAVSDDLTDISIACRCDWADDTYESGFLRGLPNDQGLLTRFQVTAGTDGGPDAFVLDATCGDVSTAILASNDQAPGFDDAGRRIGFVADVQTLGNDVYVLAVVIEWLRGSGESQQVAMYRASPPLFVPEPVLLPTRPAPDSALPWVWSVDVGPDGTLAVLGDAVESGSPVRSVFRVGLDGQPVQQLAVGDVIDGQVVCDLNAPQVTSNGDIWAVAQLGANCFGAGVRTPPNPPEWRSVYSAVVSVDEAGTVGVVLNTGDAVADGQLLSSIAQMKMGDDGKAYASVRYCEPNSLCGAVPSQVSALYGIDTQTGAEEQLFAVGDTVDDQRLRNLMDWHVSSQGVVAAVVDTEPEPCDAPCGLSTSVVRYDGSLVQGLREGQAVDGWTVAFIESLQVNDRGQVLAELTVSNDNATTDEAVYCFDGATSTAVVGAPAGIGSELLSIESLEMNASGQYVVTGLENGSTLADVGMVIGTCP